MLAAVSFKKNWAVDNKRVTANRSAEKTHKEKFGWNFSLKLQRTFGDTAVNLSSKCAT